MLQLKKLEFATEAEQQTEIYQWARMISADDWEVLFKMAEHNEYMKAAVDEMERINAQSDLRYLYLQREKKLHDEATIKRYYTELGIKEGKENGIEQGIEQGGYQVLYKLVLDGILSIDQAANQKQQTVEEFMQRLKELNLEPNS